jgi:hypothetical protein
MFDKVKSRLNGKRLTPGHQRQPPSANRQPFKGGLPMKTQSLTRQEQNLKRIEEAIVRWQTRLRRAANTLGKLEKQRKRAEKALATPSRPRGSALISDPSTLGDAIRESIQDQLKPTPVDDLAIPTFLQRKQLDPVAAEIRAEQEETKRKKAQGRIAKMKAKKSGATKAMPLTGKAALDAIRNG